MDKPSTMCGRAAENGPCNGHFQHEGPCRHAPFEGWMRGRPTILVPKQGGAR